MRAVKRTGSVWSPLILKLNAPCQIIDFERSKYYAVIQIIETCVKAIRQLAEPNERVYWVRPFCHAHRIVFRGFVWPLLLTLKPGSNATHAPVLTRLEKLLTPLC